MATVQFSHLLTQFRIQVGLSNRDLAAKAGVPHSLIAGLQSGRRRVGEQQARKIGLALGLSGEAIESFVLYALDTCTEKVLASSKPYPATLLNSLARQLRDADILPEFLSAWEIKSNNGSENIILRLHNGKAFKLITTLQAI